MKKMVVLIIILAIIFAGMVIRRNQIQSMSNINNVSAEEVNLIEEYISKIYMWSEVSGEALPKFEDINQANEIWIWQVVKKNLEEEKFSYEQIEKKAKELFGDNFQKKFPQEGIEGIITKEEENQYKATSIIIDEKEDKFLLYNIGKNENQYIVEIVEYIEDYIEGSNLEDETQEYNIILRNIQNEEIEKVKSSLSDIQKKEIIKNNIDKYTKKKIILNKKDDGNMVVTKIE